MKRFLFAGLFFLLIVLLDSAVGVIFSRALPTVKFGPLGVINKALADSSELLVLGSSRALHHYDSKVLEEALGLSCYNGGIGGHGLLYSYALLAERVSRHKPKIVVLDISPNVLVDPKALDKLTVFLPLTNHSKPFSEIVQLNPAISPISRHINSVKYNSILYDLVLSHFATTNLDKGFVPIKGTINLSTYRPVFGKKLFDNALNRKYLQRIVEICRENQMKMIMVISPSYDDFDSNGTIKEFLKRFAAETSVPLFDFSGDKDFVNRPELFKDQLHLNGKGAAIFSDILTYRLISSSRIHESTELVTLTIK